MTTISNLTLLTCLLLLSALAISSAKTCSNNRFSHGRAFKSCMDLPVLHAHLHWNYNRSTRRIQIAYRANQTSRGWIAWGINPTSAKMVGTQALVAFRKSTGAMTVYATPINSYNPSMQPGSLSFRVSNLSAEYSHQTMTMTIFAVVGPLKNKTTINHVWQAGDAVTDNVPLIHPLSGPNVRSVGRLNLLSR